MDQEHIRQYRLIRRLGEGRHGESWLAVDAAIQRSLVLKFIPPSLGADPDFQLEFLQQIERINQAKHANLAAIYSLDTEDTSRPFITREFIDGLPLLAYTGGQPMFYQQFLDLATQVARGVKAAHEFDIALGNLSPNNIMVTDKGQVRIVDFCLYWSDADIKDNANLATIPFRSPEEMRGEPVEPTSDLFTLGALFYELLTGKAVFGGESEQEIRETILGHGPDFSLTEAQRIPSDARLLIEQLTDSNPAERMRADMLVSSLEGMMSYHIHSLDDQGSIHYHRATRKYLSISVLAVLLVIFWLVLTTVYK